MISIIVNDRPYGIIKLNYPLSHSGIYNSYIGPEANNYVWNRRISDKFTMGIVITCSRLGVLDTSGGPKKGANYSTLLQDDAIRGPLANSALGQTATSPAGYNDDNNLLGTWSAVVARGTTTLQNPIEEADYYKRHVNKGRDRALLNVNLNLSRHKSSLLQL